MTIANRRCFSLGLVVVAMLLTLPCTGCSRRDKTPTSLDAARLKYDYSGLARLDENTFVVVHDAKGGMAMPRLGIVEVKGDSQVYSALPWRGPQLPSDLESICPIPGRAGEFFAVESGYRSGQGRVFHLRLARERERWVMTLKKTFYMPRYVEEVEGSVCLQGKDGRLILILGERGATRSNPTGRLRWGEINPEAANPYLSWPEMQKVPLKTIPGLSAGWRGCSDLFVDAEGGLWTSAAFDGGDEGPFHSAIRRIGKVATDEGKAPLRMDEIPETVLTLSGVKIEGLAGPFSNGFRFTIATDDESLGGTFRMVK